MKTTSIISMLALAAATIGATATTSCSKKDSPAPDIESPDEKEPEEDGGKLSAPNETRFKELREEALLYQLTKVIAAQAEGEGKSANTAEFTTDNGTKVSVFTGYFSKKQNGDAVKGTFEMPFAEIYDRGGMVLANKPLMAKKADGTLAPLVSGGQVFLDAKQEEEALGLMVGGNYQFVIPGTLTGGISPVYDTQAHVQYSDDDKMKPWKGNIGSDGNIAWEFMKWDYMYQINREAQLLMYQVIEDGQLKPTGDYMLTIANSFRVWTGIGRLYVPNGQTTTMKVNVPEGYNAQNTNVYLAYEGEKHLLAQLYSYDAAGKFFTEPDGFVPVGKKVHAIFVSESDGKFAYAIKEDINVTANATVTFEHKDLAKIDPDKLAEKVNGLK